MIHSEANDTVVDSVSPGERVPARTRSLASASDCRTSVTSRWNALPAVVNFVAMYAYRAVRLYFDPWLFLDDFGFVFNSLGAVVMVIIIIIIIVIVVIRSVF